MEQAPTTQGSASQALVALPLSEIIVSELNPRGQIDDKKLKDLAASIQEKGVLEPILVRPCNPPPTGGDSRVAVYEIICGERRFRASQIAGKSEIPAIIREMDDRQVLECQVIENLQRADIHELDEAQGYKRLIEMNNGYTPEVVAEKVGKSKAYVYGRLQLLKLHDVLKALFYKGQMNVAVASRISRLQEKDQVAVAKHFGRNEDGTFSATMRDVDNWIGENVFCNLDKTAFPKDDANLYPEAGPCTSCLKRAGASPLLFPELQKKHPNTCTDPHCLQEKVNRFVQIRLAETDKAVKVCYGWVEYTKGQNLEKQGVARIAKYGGGDAVISKKDACKSTKLGVVVAGDEAPAGSTVYVCGDRQCRTHFSRVTHESPNARAERLLREAKTRLEMSKRRAVFAALLGKVRQGRDLKLDELKLIAHRAYSRLHYDLSKELVILHGFITPAEAKRKKLKPSGEMTGGAYDDFFVGLLEKADAKETNALMLEIALFEFRDHKPYSYSGRNPDVLMDMAEKWNVDVKGISSGLDKEFREVQAKKKEADQRRKAREKAEAKKPKAGTCRHCGCTETTPCLIEGEGCSWTGKSETVCSNPKCQAAESERLGNLVKKTNKKVEREAEARKARPKSKGAKGAKAKSK